jgi:hypothetical protein
MHAFAATHARKCFSFHVSASTLVKSIFELLDHAKRQGLGASVQGNFFSSSPS